MLCIPDTLCRCLRCRPRRPLISTPKPSAQFHPSATSICQSSTIGTTAITAKTRRPDPLYYTTSGLHDSAHGGYHVCDLLFRGIAENKLREILSKWRDEEVLVEVREWVGENGHFAVELIWRSSSGQRAGYIGSLLEPTLCNLCSIYREHS